MKILKVLFCLKPCSSANPSQLGWLDLNWRQILVQNIPKPSPVAYPCTLLISPVFVGFCCAILGWVFQRLHSMLEWEDLQIGILWPATYIIYIYIPYGSVTVPAKHTSTMDIKRLTRQALYREVRISQARCSIDFELWCKSNFAGCCDVLFAGIFITLVTYVESFTEIAQLLFAVALHICVESFHLVWPAIVHLQSLAYVSNSGRNLTLSSSVFQIGGDCFGARNWPWHRPIPFPLIETRLP